MDYTYPANKKLKTTYGAVNKVTSPKKFFPSKRTPSPKRDEAKPPIVLRICRGKSRLLSDSDESESTLTPTVSTITSPNTRDEPKTAHSRVTRSTSRSLQDSGLSPATAETPSDTFSVLLSPEYIPPEKFELERKAMYDNLLGPSSPKDSVYSSTYNSQEEKNQDTENDAQDTENDSQNTPIDMEIETNLPTNTEILSQESGIPTEIESQEIDSTQSTNLEPKIDSESSDDESDCSNHQIPSPIPDLSAPDNLSIDKHRDEIMEKILEKPTEAPSVKLVISKKKGSIFKSRAMVTDTDGGKKRRALYKHKWCDVDSEKVRFINFIIYFFLV